MNQPQPPSNSPSPAQENIQLRRQVASLSQMLWEIVRLHAPETHTVELSENASDPLWQLAFVRGSEEGKLNLLAGAIPDLTDQQKKKIVRFLRGTSRSINEAMAALELSHPVAYVEKKIADRIVWEPESKEPGASHMGHWESVVSPSEAEKLLNVIHWPK